MSHRSALLTFAIALSWAVPAGAAPNAHRMVIVPGEDRFTPFSQTIRPGESVTWENDDTDDHTVVSDNAFNNAGHRGIDRLIRGTDANNGKAGTFKLRFDHPGTFVYYCRFHAHLDESKFFRGTVRADNRSLMNVTFRSPTEALDAEFVAGATARGLDGLEGHRLVGGMRASIYNAFPEGGVRALVEYMKEFERAHR